MFKIINEIISFIQYGDLPTWYYTRRGMEVGKNFNRQSGTKFDPSHCWLITIGDDVTIANKVQILAHDDTIRIYTGFGRIGAVTIGNRVFIGANSTILMGTHIGDDVIIGAGSLVTKDIPNDSIVAGNPAKIIGRTSEFVDREKKQINTENTFDKSFSYYYHVNKEKKRAMQEYFEKEGKKAYLELGQFKN